MAQRLFSDGHGSSSAAAGARDDICDVLIAEHVPYAIACQHKVVVALHQRAVPDFRLCRHLRGWEALAFVFRTQHALMSGMGPCHFLQLSVAKAARRGKHAIHTPTAHESHGAARLRDAPTLTVAVRLVVLAHGDGGGAAH